MTGIVQSHSREVSVTYKVVSPASAVSGNVSRNGLVGDCVRPRRSGDVSACRAGVIERLREQIRCIERRTPVLDSVSAIGRGSCPELRTVTAQSPWWHDAAALGSYGEVDHQGLAAHGMSSCNGPGKGFARGQDVPDQVGSPAGRLVKEDGGAFPRIPLLPAPPSSSLTGFALPTHEVVNISGPDWTLADASSPISDAVRFPLTRMPLDTAGVHEIKPALETGNHSDKQTDWASSWSAARAFCLGLAARRIVDRKVARSILWCMPRSARSRAMPVPVAPPPIISTWVFKVLLIDSFYGRICSQFRD